MIMLPAAKDTMPIRLISFARWVVRKNYKKYPEKLMVSTSVHFCPLFSAF
jgi:hypothetical protein